MVTFRAALRLLKRARHGDAVGTAGLRVERVGRQGIYR